MALLQTHKSRGRHGNLSVSTNPHFSSCKSPRCKTIAKMHLGNMWHCRGQAVKSRLKVGAASCTPPACSVPDTQSVTLRSPTHFGTAGCIGLHAVVSNLQKHSFSVGLVFEGSKTTLLTFSEKNEMGNKTLLKNTLLQVDICKKKCQLISVLKIILSKKKLYLLKY